MKYIYFFLILATSTLFAQKDFSDDWQDLYSYNDVKDFTITGNNLVAITENAMFITDLENNSSRKFSSVNGLSGSTTSSVGFDDATKTILVGYENGLIELITNSGEIFPITGIRDNLILINKKVLGFYTEAETKYVYGDFGIVELSIENAELGDSYRLDNTGFATSVNNVQIQNDVEEEKRTLYAATEKGLYSIGLNSNLSPENFENWEKITNGEINNMVNINGEIYYTKGTNVFSIKDINIPSITSVGEILDMRQDTKNSNLVLTINTETNNSRPKSSSLIEVYKSTTSDDLMVFSKESQVNLTSATSHTFTTTGAITNGNDLFVKSDSYGVLTTELNGDKLKYGEIHPEGPSGNNVFSISVHNKKLLLTYGGFDVRYNRIGNRSGISIFNTNQWINLTNQSVGGRIDYTKAIMDPENNSRILISSYDQGVVELRYDFDSNEVEYIGLWNDDNTNFVIPHLIAGFTTLNWVANMVVDKNNHIWVANARAHENRVFSKFDSNQDGGSWVDYADFETFKRFNVTHGINKMFVNNDNYVFTGSARVGVLVFDANDASENRKTGVIDSYEGSGSLISDRIFSVVADDQNKVWIGTGDGLMVFDDYENLFNESKAPASTLIIEENGTAKEFLSETRVNDILIDKAGNKWFGTQGAGLFYTSSDAQITFEIFNQGNSPLPSNNIIDLELDEETGKIYIVTDKGTLSYSADSDSGSLFGDKITEIVAYPNPAIANKVGHSTINIVAKGGGGLPVGTNLKIMDASGKLVFETNIEESDANGGRVVWNKKNLSGNRVVSGVYIVLVSSPDGTENTTTKIAIVN